MDFSNLLKNKKIIVAVTGSIAIYKSLELIRLLRKAGADVRVVMSKEAKKFITPLTFEALSLNKVLYEKSENWADEYNHIGFASWADLIIIAPATVNTINKIANGIADNLLLQTLIASIAPKLLVPAANTNMINSVITTTNLKLLKLSGYEVIEPDSGELACGVEGKGKMAEPKEIFYEALRVILKDEFYEYRGVIISGGATIERIDDVRFISNFSSAKMAKSLALAGYFLGADICYVGSDVSNLPKNMHKIKAQSANEVYEILTQCTREAKKGVLNKASLLDENQTKIIQKKPFFISAMAVSDYRPKYPQDGKLKKEAIGDEWKLELTKNRDILSSIDDEDIFKIGFKAEFDKQNAYNAAKNMLEAKNLDVVCLNILGNEVNFGSNHSKIDMIFKDKTIHLELDSKLNIAFKIFNALNN